jgi:hypothetical protein
MYGFHFFWKEFLVECLTGQLHTSIWDKGNNINNNQAYPLSGAQLKHLYIDHAEWLKENFK